ncbi:MAG: hypothetical protein GF364_02160 [Candidatus Lokiarchaeota archaeon]|nr:hypothetical protein [Candidatus Lokiarchaeota archaeon]
MPSSKKRAGYNKGLIHYNYGKGPGKSTSAFGIVVRALGHGFKPIVIQFLKKTRENEDTYTQKDELDQLEIDVSDLIEEYNVNEIDESETSNGRKSGFEYGEYVTFSSILKIPVIQLGTPSFIYSNEEPTQRHKTMCKFGFALIRRIIETQAYDLLILDEIITAIALNLIDLKSLIELLKNKREDLEIILTGREEINQLMEISDYVTEFVSKKHPFRKGIFARKGVEF